jgi:hypothetical protein
MQFLVVFPRPVCRWEDNIKRNIKELQCEDVDCFRLAAMQRSDILNTITNLRFSVNSGVLDQLNDFQLLDMDIAPWSQLFLTSSQQLLRYYFIIGHGRFHVFPNL